jgi:hypothetical protein
MPFRHETAMYGLRTYLASQSMFSAKKVSKIKDFVNSCYENFSARARGDPHDQKCIQQIEEMALLVENHEDSKIYWSRELWIYAASALAAKYVPARVAVEAAEAYWRMIEQHARPYADVQEFFDSEWWHQKPQWELVLVTSSDGRLRLTDDQNRLRYDPAYSLDKKSERIPAALKQWSLPNGMFVGDPVVKPDPEFWKMVTNNIFYDPKEDIAVMIGDYAIVDLTNLPEGFVPILVDRSEEKIGGEPKEARIIIHSFDSLPIILENLESQAKKGG